MQPLLCFDCPLALSSDPIFFSDFGALWGERTGLGVAGARSLTEDLRGGSKRVGSMASLGLLNAYGGTSSEEEDDVDRDDGGGGVESDRKEDAPQGREDGGAVATPSDLGSKADLAGARGGETGEEGTEGDRAGQQSEANDAEPCDPVVQAKVAKFLELKRSQVSHCPPPPLKSYPESITALADARDLLLFCRAAWRDATASHSLSFQGRDLIDDIRKRKSFRNPDFLQKMVEHFDIEQYGSCYPR